MGEGESNVLNLPLLYREMHKDGKTETMVFHPTSLRVVFAEDKYMHRQINGLTLEMLSDGYKQGTTGRFESNG